MVTCGKSMMMFDVQMLVMVLLSGACTGMRLERVGVGRGGGASGAGVTMGAAGGEGAVSSTSIVGYKGE